LHALLKRVIDKIGEKTLRDKVAEFVENPTIEIEGKTYSGLPLETAPAGVSHHHAYPGGFIEHVVSSTNIALALCNTIRNVYGGKVNKDLVVAGCILHDIFKPVTYIERENGTYGMAPIAERLDHLTLGVAELIRRGFPLNLVHIVDSHMGWQHGPIGPRTTEALVVHLADSADSRLNGEVLRAAQYLLRVSTGIELNRITAKEAFEIVNAKTLRGWEAVPKALERLERQRQKTLKNSTNSCC
jgi:7,8-dihydroneopterin 2',3'-cyclic phosphate phosphodiesterase